MQLPKYEWISAVKEIMPTNHRIGVMECKNGWVMVSKNLEALGILQAFVCKSEIRKVRGFRYVTPAFVMAAEISLSRFTKNTKFLETMFHNPNMNENDEDYFCVQNNIHLLGSVCVMFITTDLMVMDYAAMRETMKPLAEELARVVFSPFSPPTELRGVKTNNAGAKV